MRRNSPCNLQQRGPRGFMRVLLRARASSHARRQRSPGWDLARMGSGHASPSGPARGRPRRGPPRRRAARPRPARPGSRVPPPSSQARRRSSWASTSACALAAKRPWSVRMSTRSARSRGRPRSGAGRPAPDPRPREARPRRDGRGARPRCVRIRGAARRGNRRRRLTLRFSGGPRSAPSAATGCSASHESSAPGGHASSPGLNDPLDG